MRNMLVDRFIVHVRDSSAVHGEAVPEQAPRRERQRACHLHVAGVHHGYW